jgi:CheY-like chemotaxis protein
MNPIKILLVEDDVDLKELLLEVFSESKYKVVTASDGIEGNFKFQNQDFDLIITDIRMPKMDGISFAKHAQRVKKVPIIFMSASTEDYKTELELFEGIEVLSKPFTPRDILIKVTKLLSKNMKKIENQNLEIEAGEVVFEEGSTGDEIYFVKEGSLKILKKLDTGEDVEVVKIGAGEIIGELSGLLGTKRTATVVAETKTMLVLIPQDKINEVFKSQPKWLKVLFQTISRRLDETTKLLAREKKK